MAKDKPISTTVDPPVKNNKYPNLWFGVSLIVFGAIGWFASFMLAYEYINTLKNPDYIPGCSVSAIVSCSPNMASWQGSVFGFSNTFIGIAGFVIPIVLGVLVLSGAKFRKWVWIGYRIGMGLALCMVLWLIYQSIFNLHTLCPWCMVVWVVVFSMFWGALFRNQDLQLGQEQRELHNWSFIFVVACILAVAIIAQIQLDWLNDVMNMF